MFSLNHYISKKNAAELTDKEKAAYQAKYQRYTTDDLNSDFAKAVKLSLIKQNLFKTISPEDIATSSRLTVELTPPLTPSPTNEGPR